MGRVARFLCGAESARRPAAAGYEIQFEREPNAVKVAAGPGRVTNRMRVDLVMFAFGFGLEPTRPLNVRMESYWSDAGVPDAHAAKSTWFFPSSASPLHRPLSPRE